MNAELAHGAGKRDGCPPWGEGLDLEGEGGGEEGLLLGVLGDGAFDEIVAEGAGVDEEEAGVAEAEGAGGLGLDWELGFEPSEGRVGGGWEGVGLGDSSAEDEAEAGFLSGTLWGEQTEAGGALEPGGLDLDGEVEAAPKGLDEFAGVEVAADPDVEDEGEALADIDRRGAGAELELARKLL